MGKPRLIIFAPGTKDGGGGSGLRAMLENVQTGILDAEIAAVISYYPGGNPQTFSEDYGVPFEHAEGVDTDMFSEILERYSGEWVSLSGWNKKLDGFDPCKTINIHPAPIPAFGGKGMYGIHTHEAVLESFKKGEIRNTEITMHFVTPEYDGGPVFFRYPVALRASDTPETLQDRIKSIEHVWQPYITNLVIHGHISWDGKNKDSLTVPEWYKFR